MNQIIYSKGHQYLIKQLRKARIEAGFDQSSVARKLGKTQSYVSKIESGQRRVDIFQLKKFAEIYGKDLDFFI